MHTTASPQPLRYPRKGMFNGEEMEIGFGAVLF